MRGLATKLPTRTGEWLFQATAQAVGTVLAAATLFVIGWAVGVIDDVPVRAWASALSLIVASVILAVSVQALRTSRAEQRQAQAQSELDDILAELTSEEGLTVGRIVGPGKKPTPEEEAAAVAALAAARKRRQDEPQDDPEPGNTKDS